MSTERGVNPTTQESSEIGNSVAKTQQATTPTPTTTPKREKNPKRVAAGKLVAERTRLAREQQRKAAAEAAVIIANNKASGVNPTPCTNKAVADTQAPTNTEDETPKSTKVDISSLSATQWLAVVSIVVSLIGIYYKREELKAAFSKKKIPEPRGKPHTPDSNLVATTQPRGVKHLD